MRLLKYALLSALTVYGFSILRKRTLVENHLLLI